MDGEESGSAFFQSSRCAYLCPRWKFQCWNRFALIGSLVILQGTQSCSIMMTQHNFLVVPHLLGSSSVPFADRTSPHFFFLFAEGAATPPFEGSVSFLQSWLWAFQPCPGLVHSFYRPVISQSVSPGPTSVLNTTHILPILFPNIPSNLVITPWLDWCLKPFRGFSLV